MEDKAIRAVPWALATYGAPRALTFVSTVIMARLLEPSDFGVVALAILAVRILGITGDLGFGAAQVVRQDLDRRDQGIILTVTLVAQSLICAVGLALAPVAADVFDEPRLRSVMAVLSLHALVAGTGYFYETLVQRELEFRARFVAHATQAVTYAVLGIGLAAMGAGVWSLVSAHLAGLAVLTLTLMARAPYAVRPRFDRTRAVDLFRTGRGFMLQNGAGFLRQNIDYLVVGRVLGTTRLGYYSMAYRVAELPYWGLADPIAKVTFPGFARMRERGEDVAGAYVRVLRTIALVTVPAGIVLSGAADPIVRSVYGEQWVPAIGPLTVLGVWAVIRPLEGTAVWFLNSMGHAESIGWISGAALAAGTPLLIVAAHLGGAVGVAWVMLGSSVATFLLTAFVSGRAKEVSLAAHLRAVRGCAVAGTAGWFVSRGVAGLEVLPDGLAAVAAGVTALAAYLGALLVVDRTVLVEVRQTLIRLRGPWRQSSGTAGG